MSKRDFNWTETSEEYILKTEIAKFSSYESKLVNSRPHHFVTTPRGFQRLCYRLILDKIQLAVSLVLQVCSSLPINYNGNK